MEKGKVDQIWKKIFWGCCGGAIVLLLPGLALQMEPTLYLVLGILAAVLFVIGLSLAIYGLRCPYCKKSVYHQAMRAQKGIGFTCPKCGGKLDLK